MGTRSFRRPALVGSSMLLACLLCIGSLAASAHAGVDIATAPLPQRQGNTSPLPGDGPGSMPTASSQASAPAGSVEMEVPASEGSGAPTKKPAIRPTQIDQSKAWARWSPSTSGSYSTARLDREALRRQEQGWSQAKIARSVYAPFPVMGPASWVDTWGAPRYAGGYHPHEGQDVFCRYGAAVLAVEAGSISFGVNPLGGRSAYLTRSDGSFWYYAHLSEFSDSLSDGDHVEAGQIIGNCGNSGDAISSPPHVHFAFFAVDRTALDPMQALISMITTAESRIGLDRARAPAPAETSVQRILIPSKTAEPTVTVVQASVAPRASQAPVDPAGSIAVLALALLLPMSLVLPTPRRVLFTLVAPDARTLQDSERPSAQR